MRALSLLRTLPELTVDVLAALKGDVLLLSTKNEAQKRVGAAPSTERAPLASFYFGPDDDPPYRYTIDVDDRGLTLALDSFGPHPP